MIRQKLEYLRRQVLNMEDGQNKKNVAFTVMLPGNNNRKKRVRKRSFTEALREKYCVHDPNHLNRMYTSDFVVNIFVTGKPKTNDTDAELAYLRNVVLNDCAVSHSGVPNGGLSTLCPNVVDLDISSNCLSNWKDVLEILSHLKCLKFVNLARNPLKNVNNVLQTWTGVLPEVENLVLNDTGVGWSEILLIAGHLSSLKELHICGNDYEEISESRLSLNKSFSNLRCLRMNNNKIQRWEEVLKLSHLPHLESLILSGNPLQQIFYRDSTNSHHESGCSCMDNSNVTIHQTVSEKDIDEIVNLLITKIFEEIEESSDMDVVEDSFVNNNTAEDSTSSLQKRDKIQEEKPRMKCKCGRDKNDKKIHFAKLQLLCVSETKLNDWSHLTALTCFPQLTSIRIKDVPLASKLSPDDRRKLHIACLPSVKLLNGSEISVMERDKAERHFLRYFMEKKKKPERYYQLEAKHGKLMPLVNIDLGRSNYKEWINLTLRYKNTEISERIQVKEAVGKIRLLAMEKFNLYASKKTMKLFHLFCGPCHREEDRFEIEELIPRTESLPMSRFDIMDEDVIHIDVPEPLEKENATNKKKETEKDMPVDLSEARNEILKKIEEDGSMLTQRKRKREDSMTEDSIRHFRHMASYSRLHSVEVPAILSMDIYQKDSSRIVTGGKDKCVVVFDKDEGQAHVVLQGHTDEVNNVVYHPIEDVVISSSLDTTVRVWNVCDAKSVQVIKSHDSPVTSISLHDTGTYLLSAARDKMYALTDLDDGKVITKLQTSADSSRCTRLRFKPCSLTFVAGLEDGDVQIWDLRSKVKTNDLLGHRGEVTGVTFADNCVATSATDCCVKVWDIRNMKEMHTIQFPDKYKMQSLNYDASGDYLAVAGSDIRIYSMKFFEELRTFTEHTCTITSAKFAEDTTFLASTNVKGSLKFYRES